VPGTIIRKHVERFFWFLKNSKGFTGHGYFRMIFKEKGIKRAIWFCRKMDYDDKMYKKYGPVYYALDNRVITL
jgi:RimJ/RimL family protein N-acetyltransferase